MAKLSIHTDHTFKIVVLGDAGVGKTALLRRITDNEFSADSIATIGLNFFVRYFDMGYKTVRVNLWDTAGAERFRSITPVYVRDSQAILFVYTDKQSFTNIQGWFEFAKKHGPTNTVKILVGNKSDEEKLRVVANWQGKGFSRTEGIPFFETSAKEAFNVEATLRTAIAEILSKPDLVKEADQIGARHRLGAVDTDEVVNSGWCC